MNMEDSLEVVQKRLKYSKPLWLSLQKQRLLQNLCMHSYSQNEKQQTMWGKMGYHYLEKLNVFKSKEPHGVFPELQGKLAGVTIRTLWHIEI